jgi:hypothetical protein
MDLEKHCPIKNAIAREYLMADYGLPFHRHGQAGVIWEQKEFGYYLD